MMALLAQNVPLRMLWGFDAVVLVCALLLGHPWIAVFGAIGHFGVDAFFSRTVRRWLQEAEREEPADGFRRIFWLNLVRCCFYLAPALAIALVGRGVADAAYLGVIAGLMMVIGLADGNFSRLMPWAMAGPALAAVLTAAVVLLTPPEATALVLALGLLGFTLGSINHLTVQVVGEWHKAYQAKGDMIQRLEVARDEARQATQAKANFLATMSHEIRTPLNGVLGMAQVLRRDERDARQVERLDTLIASGEYLLGILNDILDISKIDAGRMDLAPKVEDLPRMLEELIAFWSPRAAEKGLVLRLDLDESVPRYVWVDALRLRQVLFNLVGNALKFTEDGSVELAVSARPHGESAAHVTLTVRDTGVGIPEEYMATLFERFSQADESGQRRFGGTGLGLAIVRQLVELMNGKVSVDSEPGEGSAFRVELVLELAQAPVQQAQESDASDPAVEQPLRILAVDDNAVNLLVLDQVLAVFGHEVVKCATGAAALDEAQSRVFDLILLDIQMPGLGGVEVLRRLRTAGCPNRETPVIALTADAMSGGRDHYVAQGFDDHAAKPIQIPDLMAAMARALRIGAERVRLAS